MILSPSFSLEGVILYNSKGKYVVMYKQSLGGNMKFFLLKKDKDSTIAKNDTVFPVNNFFVVLTLVSSLVNSVGIFFPIISHSGNIIEMCFFVMFSVLLAAFSFVSTMGLANAAAPIKNVFPLLLLVIVLITNYNIYFR
ncbi:hypothetical protein G800_04734 [Escherichia coli HVH 142 (4-5627451)]|nr:hypothetical protein G800_04734 [Escherichia coli HVH 142 (4-5627451)]